MAHQHRFLKHRMIERDTEREPQIVETGMGFFFVGTTCTLHKERPHTHYPIIVVVQNTKPKEEQSSGIEYQNLLLYLRGWMDCHVVFGKMLFGMDVVYKSDTEGYI
ncbi:uncharacterized protein LOC112016847 [Quercus suber]|uniref:uncharacterized protein LOC112016847 n=1 Tax=Quercus suber TaxID=58331 RepID=UPI0032DFC647